MKHAFKIFATVVLIGFIAGAGSIGWFLYDWSREMSPATYLSWLDTNPSVYGNVDSISESDLAWFAYCYEENEFANAIPDATRLPNIADTNGNVPAFKLGDDIFVLTWKWVNSSAGLAISDSPDFESRIESINNCFRVRHLSGNVYEWELDLDSATISGPQCRLGFPPSLASRQKRDWLSFDRRTIEMHRSAKGDRHNRRTEIRVQPQMKSSQSPFASLAK